METVVKTIFFGFTPKMIKQSYQMVKHNCPRTCVFNNQIRAANFAGQSFSSRTSEKSFPYISSVLSGAKDVEVSSAEFEGFSATTSSNSDEPQKQVKISVEVSGTTTQTIFDKVFDRMVAEAQPIPGFRRVKGGKTPNIPKHILLEVLGRSKVLKQVIKKVINSTIAEYVDKKGLKVSKDMRVEQSFEDLESSFEAGQAFSFDAVLQLK